MMLMGKEKEDYKDYVIYDAKDKVLGRFASTVAKELLKGKKVAVVNAERAFITGNKKVIAKRYRVRLNLQEKENPEHSPYWSRRPDMLVRRIVRGMLPYHKKPSGKAAYKRLSVFVGMPKELNGLKAIEVKTKAPRNMYVGYVYVGELSKLLGYNSQVSRRWRKTREIGCGERGRSGSGEAERLNKRQPRLLPRGEQRPRGRRRAKKGQRSYS